MGKMAIIRGQEKEYLCFLGQLGIANVGQAGNTAIHEGCYSPADEHQKKGKHQKNQKYHDGREFR